MYQVIVAISSYTSQLPIKTIIRYTTVCPRRLWCLRAMRICESAEAAIRLHASPCAASPHLELVSTSGGSGTGEGQQGTAFERGLQTVSQDVYRSHNRQPFAYTCVGLPKRFSGISHAVNCEHAVQARAASELELQVVEHNNRQGS